jgi:hypothetical protein
MNGILNLPAKDGVVDIVMQASIVGEIYNDGTIRNSFPIDTE